MPASPVQNSKTLRLGVQSDEPSNSRNGPTLGHVPLRIASHELLDVADEHELHTPKEHCLSPGIPDLSFSVGQCSRQGLRERMEDRVIVTDLSSSPQFLPVCGCALLLGVFDGHAGHEAAQHLADQFTKALLSSPLLLLDTCQDAELHSDNTNGWQAGIHEDLQGQKDAVGPPDRGQQQQQQQLTQPRGAAVSSRRDYGGALRQALLQCEVELLDAALASGCTALVALMVDGALHIANVGDCRAVVCDEAVARPLTLDHKPLGNAHERARLKAFGAEVSPDGYVLSHDGRHDLAVSRALGGTPLKRPQSMMALARADSVNSSMSGSSGYTRPGSTEPTVSLPAPGAASAAAVAALLPKPAVSIARCFAAAGSEERWVEGQTLSSPCQPAAAISGSPFCTDTAASFLAVPAPPPAPAATSGGLPSLGSLPATSAMGLGGPFGALSIGGQPPSVDVRMPSSAVGSSASIESLASMDGGTARLVVSSPVYVASGVASLRSEESTSGVIAEPELFQYTVHQGSEFLILASDGIWDKVGNAEAVLRVRRWLAEDGLSTVQAAERLVDYAMRLGTDDNASVVLLRFSARPFELRRKALGSAGARPAFANSALRRARSDAGLFVAGPACPQHVPSPGHTAMPTLHEVSPGQGGQQQQQQQQQQQVAVLPVASRLVAQSS